MLYEANVVNAVCDVLESKGYRIERKAGTRQQGYDIIAVKGTPISRRLYIEAKGETSSDPNSARYGDAFDDNQIRTHVARALSKATEALSEPTGSEELRAGIAFPDTEGHHRTVDRIQPILNRLEIAVFWVYQDDRVEIISDWEL
jgi:hypothetical protein